MGQALKEYTIFPKVISRPRPNLIVTQVVEAVRDRIPYRFTVTMHTAATRSLKIRLPKGAADETATDARYCEYVGSVKRHLYNQAWVERLVSELSSPDGFRAATGIDSPTAAIGRNSTRETDVGWGELPDLGSNAPFGEISHGVSATYLTPQSRPRAQPPTLPPGAVVSGRLAGAGQGSVSQTAAAWRWRRWGLGVPAPQDGWPVELAAWRGWRGSSGGTKALLPLPSTRAQPLVVFKAWW